MSEDSTGKEVKSNSEYFAELKQMVRKATLIRSKQYFQTDLVEESVISDGVPIFGYWMSMIMVAGNSLRLTLKVQYNTNAVIQLGGALLKSDLADVSDFMKEYCNLVAGLIKNRIEAKELRIGISLPLVTHGFDEIFYKYQTGPFSSLDVWKLSAGNASIWLLMFVEAFDESVLKSLDGISQIDEGEVKKSQGMEFL